MIPEFPKLTMKAQASTTNDTNIANREERAKKKGGQQSIPENFY